jgi:hypothetical protein
VDGGADRKAEQAPEHHEQQTLDSSRRELTVAQVQLRAEGRQQGNAHRGDDGQSEDREKQR